MSNRAHNPRAALHSVGCKLNQYECQVWAQALRERGCEIVDFDSSADVYILNTCTVTSRTDRECRRLARGARRRNPQALVVVTGCYAETAGEELARNDLADLILGRAEKPSLIARVTERLSDSVLPLSVSERRPGGEAGQRGAGGAALPLLREFAGHARAFLKVQEGCAGGCTFCIISRARGPECSVPSARVVQEAALLSERHAELVLVGTHLGRYGRDLPGEPDLAELVERLSALPELEVGRLRLSSLEPLEVTPALIDQIAAGGQALSPDASRPALGKLCRHLHLPLQSGADTVLERMGRPYTSQTYADLVLELKRRQPGLCLGADVIVGFPGETEEEFAATVAFLEELPFSYLHVFTYSPRPGTPAATLPGQVPGHVKKRRNHLLRALSERKREAFAQSQVGQRLEVVLEEVRAGGEARGLSDNYLEVTVSSLPEALPPGLISVEITRAAAARLIARTISPTE